MERIVKTGYRSLIVVSSLLWSMTGAGAMPADDPDKASGTVQTGEPGPARRLPSVNEARDRAKLLHDTVHATLQIVHRQYYREDEGLTIPAATLKGVFQELSDRQKIEIRWLAVNAQAMNVDHKPRDEFEMNAVKAILSGKEDYEHAQDGIYRRVGIITLTSDCLKCHLPTRTSTKDRAAGLIIAIPVEKN